VQDYELTIIIKPDVNDEEATALVEKLKGFITERKGEIVEATTWGKKKMAYPILGFKEGAYHIFKLKLPATAPKVIEANLKITEKVMRHLLVRTSK
jgi:small subunit ribosomal protein S6